MIFYFAGTESVVCDYKNDFGINNYLISFASFNVPRFKKWLQIAGFKPNQKSKAKKLFLDCGAFSIERGKSKLTFYDYIDFLQRFGKTFDYIAAMDVIGDPVSTLNNYKDMVSLGYPDCIPTWHHKEPIEYFDKYCAMTDYVAVGGIATLNFKDPELTNLLVRKIIERKPKETKIHLFGIGSNSIIKRWGHAIESVDNTSWLAFGKFTNVMTRYAKVITNYRDVNNRYHTKDELLQIKLYNVRRYQELENDINAATKLANNGNSTGDKIRPKIKA